MNETESATGGNLKTWLFNPFHYLAGGKALGLGLTVILISGLIGWIGNVHLDGVLDWHTGGQVKAPLWFFLAEGLIDWLSLAILLLIAGIILSKSRVRALDVLGTQALARWPMLPAVFLGLIPAVYAFSDYLKERLLPGQGSAGAGVGTIALGVVCTILAILMIIWMVALMYRAYAVSCNLKGARAVVSFIVVLLLAEAVSKIVLARLAGNLTGLIQ